MDFDDHGGPQIHDSPQSQVSSLRSQGLDAANNDEVRSRRMRELLFDLN